MSNKDKIIVEPKEKPEFKQFRTWIAFRLVALANWVRPGNEAALAYWTGIMQESMLEEMLYGKSVMEVKVRKHKRKKKGYNEDYYADYGL